MPTLPSDRDPAGQAKTEGRRTQPFSPGHKRYVLGMSILLAALSGILLFLTFFGL